METDRTPRRGRTSEAKERKTGIAQPHDTYEGRTASELSLQEQSDLLDGLIKQFKQQQIEKDLLDEKDRVMKAKISRVRESYVQKMFFALSALAIGVTMLFVLYLNFQLIEHSLNGIIIALLVFIMLQPLREYLLWLLRSTDVALRPHTMKISATAVLALSVCTAVGGYSTPFLVFAVLSSIALLVIYFADRESLVAMLLMLVVIFVIFFPVAFMLRICVEESKMISNNVVAFIEDNNDLQKVLTDYTTSKPYRVAIEQLKVWGFPEMENRTKPDAVKGYLAEGVRLASSNLAGFFGAGLQVLTNISDLVVDFVTFFTFLFFFLQEGQNLWVYVAELSPLTQRDGVEIFRSVKRSTYRIFVCSGLVFITHFLVTYASFHACGFKVTFILSFASGFLSMLPLFSSWLIWLPASIGLVMSERVGEGVAVALLQLFVRFYLDYLIYEFIPGHSYYVGLSIVAGISVWGALGFVYGPLVCGVTISFLDIYKRYTKEMLISDTPRGIDNASHIRRHFAGSSSANNSGSEDGGKKIGFPRDAKTSGRLGAVRRAQSAIKRRKGSE